MAKTEESKNLSDEDIAKEILESLPNAPLLVDIVTEVRRCRQIGLTDKQVKKVVTETFTVKDKCEPPKDDEEITVSNMPEKYNKLDWS